MTEKTTKKTPVKKTASAKKAAPVKASAKAKSEKKAPKEKSTAFAVVRTGGKQYVVREGDTLTIEKLAGDYKAGDKITFDDVLLVSDGTKTTVGTPKVAGAKVSATFVEEGKGKKILVVRFKSKSNYHKVKGHRQPYAKVTIAKI